MRNRSWLLIPALLLAACGSTATPSASGVLGPNSSSGAPQSSGARVDPCALVSTSDVESAIGKLTNAPTKVTSPVPGAAAAACAFTSADAVLTIAVADQAMTRATFESAMKGFPSATAETGIGDEAFSGTVSVPASGGGDAATVFGLRGSTYFTVQVASRSGRKPIDIAREIAKKVAAGL
jgi:hypothetical protein